MTRARLGPLMLVGAAVGWNLVNLRPQLLEVPYLDDSSVHEQMVRFATQQFRGGHLPLLSWFPYLGLGSPQFLHYQSLPAMLTGLIGLAVGPDTAFRWTFYILLSVWPISVYLAARLFGAGRLAAAASAAMSPFVFSAVGIGYEQKAYVWIGYGVWTQLWASLTLPLAWGYSWRAIREGRSFAAAVVLVSLTAALHFESGYLALIPLLLWPLIAGSPIFARVRRAAVLAAGSLLVSAWVIMPLIEQRAWAASNEILRGTTDSNGYGAVRVLSWLVSGQLLDYRRLPVVTVFAGVGLALACARLATDPNARALLVVLGACLLLSFGRTTFGAVADVIPGSTDIFFRRFMMGIQLAALLLAGGGAAWCGATFLRALDRWKARLGLAWPPPTPTTRTWRATLAFGAMVVVLAPAWLQLGAFDSHNSAAIDAQRRADASQGVDVDRLIAIVKRDGGGRVYAGTPSNFGVASAVGAVPVFKYLESRDVDEVGYTLRTASLMTDPEYFFDESNPADYSLFAVRYLLLAAGRRPPVPAHLVRCAGAFCLWRTATAGYVHVGRIVGELSADRANVGFRSIDLLRSPLAQESDYLRVAFDRPGRAIRRLPTSPPEAAAGSVIAESDELDHGEVAVTVRMRRPGVAVLSASFDPGWTATVDGRPEATQMVAPALVATTVTAGTHNIVFRYRGFGAYPELFALSGLTLFAFLGAALMQRRSLPRGERVHSTVATHV